MAVEKKRTNHNSLARTGEGSSRTQNTIIPNNRISEAGAPTMPSGAPSILRKRSPPRSESICWNHGVNMKAMNKPTPTTIHAAHRNRREALSDLSHCIWLISATHYNTPRAGCIQSLVVEISPLHLLTRVMSVIAVLKRYRWPNLSEKTVYTLDTKSRRPGS